MKSKLPPRRFFGGFTRKVPIFFQISSNHKPSPTPKLQGQRDQGCRADGKALSDGCCGVSRRIQRIGAAAHFGIEQGHLLAETCIGKDWEIQNGRKQAFSNKKHPFNSSRFQLFAGLRPAIEVEIATCNVCVSVKPWNCSETGWEHPQFLTPSVSNATCIVADGTETIDGQTTAERGQHAQCCQCNTIEIAHLEGDKNGLTEALKLDDGLFLVKNGGTYVRKLATVILHFFWEHPFSTTKKISKTMLLLPLFQFWSSSLTTLRLPVLSPYPSGHLDRSLRSSRRRQHKDRNDAALVS